MALDVRLRAIGVVRNGVADRFCHDWQGVESELALEPELEPALEGIEGFSHVQVVLYFHQVRPEEVVLQRRPRDRQDFPLVGIFATRSQFRPSPVGISVARLLGREGHRLKVADLDAVDGTPIIDIKPYFPPPEPPETVRVPPWVQQMLAERGQHR